MKTTIIGAKLIPISQKRSLSDLQTFASLCELGLQDVALFAIMDLWLTDELTTPRNRYRVLTMFRLTETILRQPSHEWFGSDTCAYIGKIGLISCAFSNHEVP